MEQQQKTLKLLPNYYKKVGAGLFLFTLFIVLPGVWFVKQSEPQLLYPYQAFLPTLFLDFLILGLGLYAFAKDKIEDELITLLRLQSMAYAFLWVVFYVVLNPLIDYFLRNRLIELNTQIIVLMMLGLYSTMFFYQKKKMS